MTEPQTPASMLDTTDPATDPELGKAFRLAFSKDVRNGQQLDAFVTVARMIAARLSDEEITRIERATKIDLRKPVWHDDCQPF
jgi:hypothetical protein